MNPRRLALVALLLAACQVPEDPMPVTGRVTSITGPRGGVEVRLLRNLTTGFACDDLKELATTVTAPDGTYRFDLIRQQVTLGVSRDRWFRVEAEGPARTSYSFLFANAPMRLPDLPVDGAFQAATPQPRFFKEVVLDGHVAWRTASGGQTPYFDRETLQGGAWTQYRVLIVEENDLGVSGTVPLEVRLESGQATLPPASPAPPSRGMPCPGVGIEPCPFTDGRHLPVALPPDFRALALDLGTETNVVEVQLYGIRFASPPVRLRVEWSPVSPAAWETDVFSTPLAAGELSENGNHCEEPGAFIRVAVLVPSLARMIRLSAAGPDGQLVPWLSLQEVVVR